MPRLFHPFVPKPRSASGPSVLLLFATLLALPLATGCQPGGGKGATGNDTEAPSNEEQPEEATPVEVVLPTRGRVEETITLSGDLSAANRADLTSQVSGVVLRVPAKEGIAVEKGALLIALDPSDVDLAVREKELAHRDAVARSQNAQLERTESEQTEAIRKLAFEKAQREFQRIESIVAGAQVSPLSEEEVDAKRFARDEAKAAWETAKLSRERAQVSAQLGEIAVDQAKAALDRAELNRSRTAIIAPFDGVVSFVEVRPGELVQTGTRVAEVVNPVDLYTEVRVPQRRMAAVEIGQPVSLVSETLPGNTFEGRVDTIHPTVDPTQGTVKVRIAIDDPTQVLRPGAYVSATIVLEARDNALLVPKRCRLFDGPESIVYVVREDRAVRVPITLGLQTATALEVIPEEGGLRPDDQLIVRGQTRVRPDVPVRIDDPNASASPADETSTAQAEETTDREEG
ncbi:MAG: efflux RND transporter periplasmic adaptor subunit [Planctomycetota bacterium]